MVIIAYNYDGYPISIVNAKSKELAMAYWQGLGSIPHSTKTLEEDFTPLEEHPTGVYPILKTLERDGYELKDYKKQILTVTK